MTNDTKESFTSLINKNFTKTQDLLFTNKNKQSKEKPTMTSKTEGRFPDPHEFEVPAELEGWEEMYPSHQLFFWR